jgi:hypothetical protein
MRVEKACPAVVETVEKRDAANHQLASAVVESVNAAGRGEQLDILQVRVENSRRVGEGHQFNQLATRRAKRCARASQNEISRIKLVYDFILFHSVGYVSGRTDPKSRISQVWRFIG